MDGFMYLYNDDYPKIPSNLKYNIMKRLIILFFPFLAFCISNAQIPVGKTTMDYEIERDGKVLKMNGAGVRSLAFIELYAAGLYLNKKSKDPIAVCYDNENMSIRIKITSRLISRETMVNAITEGFKKATDGNTEELKDRIELVNTYYAKEIKKGDVLELNYIKDKGVVCMMNEKELGVIPGQDFKFALYKIWLGDKPVKANLKKGLLGV